MPKVKRATPKFNRYWLFVGAVSAFLLLVYVVIEALQVPVLTDTSVLSGLSGGTYQPLLGVGLLAADVLLPVPSSLIMTAHGALFGLFAGAMLSLAGSLLGFALAFWLGRRTSPAIRRLLMPEETARAARVLQKWGLLAIVITRPVPILAETTAIAAGTSGLSFGKSLLAAVAGLLPGCLVYAWAGVRARDFGAAAIIFLVLVAIAAIIWARQKHRVHD